MLYIILLNLNFEDIILRIKATMEASIIGIRGKMTIPTIIYKKQLILAVLFI